MPVVQYPYMVITGRPSPLIPLGVGYQGTWQRAQAYVDSGAFYSIFKPALAQSTGTGLAAWRARQCPGR